MAKMAGLRNGRANMIEDLSELQRRMLSRQQQYYAQCATSNSIALIAAILIMGFVFVLAWEQKSPLKLGVDADYAASYIGSDRESPAQGEPSQDAPASP
jgi:hypothetical protein